MAIILRSSAPDSAVEVANPDLKLCPPYLFASNPAKVAYFFIIKATLLSEISNIFPDLISQLSIQCFQSKNWTKSFVIKVGDSFNHSFSRLICF